MQKIWSFDVFDTLIARSIAEPSDIFVQAAVKLAETETLPICPEVYATERFNAERRLLDKGQMPPLDAIGFELSQSTGLSTTLVQSLLTIELELEKIGFWPIPENVAEVDRLRRADGQIIFISDTYLSSSFLKSALNDFGIAAADEPVFVSCEHGVGKKSGGLFVKVAELLGIRPNQITHYGDNHRADIEGARLAGARGIAVNGTHLNKYEKAIRSFANNWPVSLAVRIHLSKLAAELHKVRLQNQSSCPPLFDVSVAVAGPMLHAFTQKTLQWAAKNKVDRLYFLSRDGDILLQIAQMVAEPQHPDTPELRYLHVSRAVALLANLSKQASANQLRSLVLALRPVSLRDFIDHVAGKGSPWMGSYAETELKKSISHLEIDHITAPLLSNSSLYDQVYHYNKERQRLFQDYLTQEGVVSKDAVVALVDVGWRLTMHELIANTLISAGCPPPSGYYIGIDRVETNARTGRKQAFLWDSRQRPCWVGVEGVTRIIEVFCTADQGRVTDYQRTSSKICPNFSVDEAKLYKEWGLDHVRSGILESVKALRGLKQPADFHTWQPLLLIDLIRRFWSDPTDQEIYAWGRYPFEIIPGGSGDIPLFVPSSLFEKSRFLLRNGSWRGNMINSWAAANEKTTSFPIRVLLKLMYKASKSLR